MTNRADRIRQAQEAGEATRAGARRSDDWVKRLPPASERMWREALLDSLSPAMREAVEAVEAAWKPRPPKPDG